MGDYYVLASTRGLICEQLQHLSLLGCSHDHSSGHENGQLPAICFPSATHVAAMLRLLSRALPQMP